MIQSPGRSEVVAMHQLSCLVSNTSLSLFFRCPVALSTGIADGVGRLTVEQEWQDDLAQLICTIFTPA
jgi:hypothetical protein